MAERDSTCTFEEKPVEYKDVPGFPGYRVGDDGSVWSIALGEWRRLRGAVNHSGYLQVNLKKNGRQRSEFVHRLVLLSFVGPCPDGYQGCHFPNADKMCNRLDNLRWDSPKANCADRVLHGTAARRQRGREERK